VPSAHARLGNRAVRDVDRRLLDRMVEELRADGISVSDDFLPPPDVRALADCAALRRSRGEFVAARIGADGGLQRREDVRGDLICWLAGALLPAETYVLGAFEQLRLSLNEDAYLGLLDLELHYAWYAPGAVYARHVDQPRGRSARRVSLALYLNERRSPADGGALRIEGDDGRFRDIEPVGGRLVLFLSESREHEVLLTQVPRLSLTGWFRGPE
jgi:SM-20-related protein